MKMLESASKDRNIFIYWSGYEYKLIKILRDIMVHHSVGSYSLILLTEENITEYIDLHPKYDTIKCLAHKADYIRVNVVNKYGGIWLDSDTLVMNDLSELFAFIDEFDGFFVEENNAVIGNGVFGSKKNTNVMKSWVEFINQRLDYKPCNEWCWTEIGNNFLQGKRGEILNSYKVLKGLDTVYPVNWDKCVENFLDKPYDNYKNLIREFQPFIVLVNSVYKQYESMTEEQIRETPLTYFINKSLSNNYKETFTKIYEEGVWNNKNPNTPLSGPGSALGNAKVFSETLDKFIIDNNITNVLDLGCGDLNWIQHAKFFNDKNINYVGVDIVEFLINNHKNKFPHKEFINDDLIKFRPSECVDIIILRDVIFHLKLKDIKIIFDNLKSKFKYLCITTHDLPAGNTNDFDKYHFVKRDLFKEPFNVGIPLLKVYEKQFDRYVCFFEHNQFYMVNSETPHSENIVLQQELEHTISQVLLQGEHHYRAGEIQAAEDLFRAVLEVQPDNPEANHNLGVLLVERQQFQEAFPYFKSAVTENPTCEQYWLSYIEALILAEQIDAAQKTLERARQHVLQGELMENLTKRLSDISALNSVGKNQRPLTEVEIELAKVKRELVIVKMERDILKKAAAYYSKELLPDMR